MYLRYRNNRTAWVAGLIFYMILILVASLKPAAQNADTSWIKEMLHNLCHVPAYAGMAFLLIGVFRVFSVKRVFVKAFFFSLLYGIIMEFFQGLVPGRTPSLLDMGLNTLGALITIFLVRKGLLKGFLSD